MRFAVGLLIVAVGLAALPLLLWLGQRRLMCFPYGGPVPHARAAGLPTAKCGVTSCVATFCTV
jgi:hypothetical protein